MLACAREGEGRETPYKEIYEDASLGWRDVARNLTVVDVDGGHSSMLQEQFVDSLAEALKPYIPSQLTGITKLSAGMHQSEMNTVSSWLLSTCGGIRDLILDLEWDRTTLLNEVARRAAVLAARSVGPGSIVAITHGGTARFFADLFAVWSIGATAACLDNTLTANEVKNVVDFAGASLVLADGPTQIEGLTAPVLLLSGMQPSGSDVPASEFKPDDPALLLFTSGTTGIPKGVVLTYGAVSARINANIAAIGKDKLARALVTLPSFFGHGLIGNSLTPLLSGGTIVLHPRGMPLIDNLGKIIDEHEISFMSSVPSLWRLALTCSPPPVGKTLRRVHVGSAPLSASLWSEIEAWAGAEVVNCYGITETANWIAGASSRDDGIADGLVGKMWGGNAGVMDDAGIIQSRGSGEVVINSSCLMSGYYKRPDLTQAAFSNGWFRTGDTGTIDDNGRIWVTGRIKDEINRGGFKVQPAEIDSLLESHPAIAEACAFGIPDPMGGEAVAAAIRLNEGEKITSVSLQTWCNERLRRAAVPEHWFFVSEIPRTGRGKVSRDNVRKLLVKDGNSHGVARDLTKTASATAAASFTGTERQVLNIWQYVLGSEGRGVDDDFFALGGTSLMAARLLAQISRQFGAKLPLSAILRFSTVRTLAGQIDKQLNRAGEEDEQSSTSLVDLKSGGTKNFFFVHDGEGETLLYLNLAKRLPDDINVVGIEPHAIPGIPLAQASIEDMAKAYIQDVRSRQAQGPYLLGGMCAGGVIAYEMAAQLVRSGEKVELVALLDAPTPHAEKRRGRISQHRLERLKSAIERNQKPGSNAITDGIRIAATVARKLANATRYEVEQRLKDLSIEARFLIMQNVVAHHHTWPRFIPELSAHQILNSAQARYTPAQLSALPIVLVRAKYGEGTDTPYSLIYADEALGWRDFTKTLKIVDVEGGHSSMLQEAYVDFLANALSPLVENFNNSA